MIATRYGQFSTEKISKVLFKVLKADQTCRERTAIILSKQITDKKPTALDIDIFIMNTIVPQCIANGTAKTIVEEYLDTKESLTAQRK